MLAIGGGGGGGGRGKESNMMCDAATDWGHHTVIPTRMMGIHLDEELHMARILVSTDDQELRVAIDFASHELIVSTVPNRGRAGSTGSSNPADWSPSYSTMGTQSSDVIRIGDHRYRVPIRYDPSATSHFGCPSCHGILGLGPGSPIWLRWESATFSAGAITLGKTLPPVEGSGRVRIDCEPLAGEELCVSFGRVYDEEYRIRFRFRSAYTIVPNKVYDSYVGTRSVGDTSIRDWPSLRLTFPSVDAPSDPRNTTLRVRAESLLGESMRGGAPILLMKRDPDPGSQTITLGRSVWRSLMLHREFTKGRAVIETHHSIKRFPNWAIIVGVTIIVLLVRWWMTRDALFYEHISLSRLEGAQYIQQQQQQQHSRRRRGQSRKIGGGYSPMSLPLPVSSSFGSASGIPYKIRVRRWLEQAHKKERNIFYSLFQNSFGNRFNASRDPLYPGEWGFYPDRLLIELIAVGGAIAFLYIPELSRPFRNGHIEFWIFLQVITYASVAWLGLAWFTRILGQADVFGVLPFHKAGSGRVYAVFRVGLVCQATVNILLSVMLIALAAMTRADSLGTIIMTLASSLLAGNVMYHMMAAVIHAFRFDYQYSVGRRGGAIWILWIIYGVLLYATTGVFVSAFVLIPMIRIQVVWANPAQFVAASFTVFIIGLLFAFWLANNEAERMADWVRRHEAEKDHHGGGSGGVVHGSRKSDPLSAAPLPMRFLRGRPLTLRASATQNFESVNHKNDHPHDDVEPPSYHDHGDIDRHHQSIGITGDGA